MAKIIMHGIGGAGINITAQAFREMDSLKQKGFSTLSVNFLDTSDGNVKPINDIGRKLHMVKSAKASVDEIAGSGSERGTNVMDAKISVKNYLDDIGVLKDNVNDIHVIVVSGSGGSGSSVGLLLLRELLLKDCAVVTIVVGDNDSQMYCKNTTKTIESLSGMSKVLKKIITTYYVNNSFYNGALGERQNSANRTVLGFVYSLLLITADSNKELDKADIRALFKQSSFSTINIPTGVSFITDVASEINHSDDNCSLTLVRTITDTIENSPELTSALHTKLGFITKEEMVEESKAFLPISLVTKSGCINDIMRMQVMKNNEYEEHSSGLARDELEVECDDDTGLVF